MTSEMSTSLYEMTSEWDNVTSSGNSTQAICVMCRYYLEPWLKGLRVTFGSCIVLANIVTFILLLRAKTLQMALRYFLLNVAVVDAVYGFGFLYHSAIVDYPQFIVMNLECKIRYGALCMVSMVAMFTLMAMCVERVVALKFAFSYQRLITRTNILIGLFFFWAVPTAIVTPTYTLMDSSVGECNFVRFISSASFVVFSVTYFCFMIIAIMSQLILLYITRTHIKKIIPTLVGDQKEKTAFKMNVKATSTTLALAVPFVICATPKVLTYMYLAFKPDERIKVESLTLLAVTVYLNVSNSLLNPLVYCWRLSELRKQILAAFGRKSVSTFTSSEPVANHGVYNKGSNTSSSEDKGNNQNKCVVVAQENAPKSAGTWADKLDNEQFGKGLEKISNEDKLKINQVSDSKQKGSNPLVAGTNEGVEYSSINNSVAPTPTKLAFEKVEGNTNKEDSLGYGRVQDIEGSQIRGSSCSSTTGQNSPWGLI